MHMNPPWLIAGLVLGSAVVLYFAIRLYRRLSGRLEEERQQARKMAELQMATVEALALAIDAKDQIAPNHIRRVQTYATGVARALGMSEDEIQGVRTAALLHDIGKLAVPEHILAKPGPLTPEEFQKVRIHPQVGADIIASVPFPYPVAPLILSHHERWDGRGYPSGLKGEEIPLGARILCVVDYFDALTSDRPYHKAMGNEAALAILQQDSGKALDPGVVSAFARIMPRLRTEVEKEELEAPRPSASVARRGEGLRTIGALAQEGKATVFDDIALAHREIYALYQIAQTMGTSLGVEDTMALIASKLTNLVPFSACALFLYSDTNDTLNCRFATGTDSELLQQLTLRSGQGLTGWVARNRRPLVNARPSADIEAMNSDAPTELQSALVCPLILGERFIGTLAVYHTEPSFYRDDHRRLLDRVCEQAAAVINNSIVFQQTQEDSLTDPLTGLPNTRFMFMHLQRELARADRLKSEVSLLVMDLNDFKEINDNHGHHIGDKALRAVAGMLRAAIRPYDICVRYAGDEFIVVLSGCGHEEAEAKRVELKQAIDELVFEPRPGTPLPLAISAGAAVFPHDGDSYESLLAKADSRMYHDKSQRKNDPSRQLGEATSYEMTPAARHTSRPN
jgi:diguanylate cyclase (GGDEF)-like protein/putative nucleotidyltransferase with HDIG domain